MVVEECYHTQEKRVNRISAPIKCIRDDAWLGEAFYFWLEESDAIFWGIKSKRRTGEYEIYRAEIDFENILDTVFNKEHYYFWIKQIEKAAKNMIKKAGIKPSLKELNDYFLENGIWTELDGILFQDISQNSDHYMVKEFQYKKRIQLAVYNEQIIHNFVYYYEGNCL